MKNFQKILNGEIQTSTEIKNEIKALTGSGQETEANLPELEKTLEKARTDLLAETPGAMDKIKKAEEAISENKNKKLGISGILKDLNLALEKALTSETIKRQAEFKQEIAKIGDEVLELQQKILKHFSAAATFVNKLHGNEREDLNLGYDYFRRCNLSEELQRQIAAGTADQEGVSLYTRREQLQREIERLSKQS